MTGRTLRLHGAFVSLARMFRLTASTVNGLVEHLGAGVLHVRHDQAGVDPCGRPLPPPPPPARARPCPGLGTCRVAARALAPSTRIGPFGLRDSLPSPLRQD